MRSVTVLAALTLCASAAGAQVQVGTSVRPETTTVGEHFIATVRVRVPAGTQVVFPARPDTSARVDSAGGVTRTESTTGGFDESTVNYVLAAWDTGGQRLGLDSVAVIGPNGERYVQLAGFKVYVRSVLPADTALRKPKPFRPAMPVKAFDWLPWLIAAAAALLAALLVIIWRRWRRRLALGLTPVQIAERDFSRVESRRLIESGEIEQFAVEMIAIVRRYLASVVPDAAQSATTQELAFALRNSRFVPVHRLIDALDATDLMKFARARSTADRAREIGAEARRMVSETHAALEAAKVAEAKAA
jgi:hypothetical protein